jgi:flagellar motor switch protein FliG
MRKLALIFILPLMAVSLGLSQTTPSIPDPMSASLMQKQDSLRRETENKIKTEILDPIFGADRSYVFADVELEVVAKKAEQNKEGVGVIQKYKEKGAGQGSNADTDFILPGIPKPKSVTGADNKRPEAAQGQQAQQAKGVQEIRYGLETDITRFQVTVIHDDTIPKPTLDMARQRVEQFLLPYKIHGKDAATVVFQPTKFHAAKIIDDLKRPSVYLPLLYALLFLILLLFLFGPLWGFFRKYVKALMAKPGAEVNIEDKREEGGGEGEGEGKEETEGHQSIDMNFLQKEEEKNEEEDESMKKFEPFTYLNEENLKRLIYLFLLRKEDPWVIAVVLSYMKPELSRQALSMLPVEMQSRVALEALTVRQATREQIDAIDKDIKENVDFVMGGIERLSKMLEDSDPATRKNIIEYLKTQKPDIYEKVKRIVLMFEDVVNFPDRDMQTIIRNLNNEDVAKALAKADPAIVNKFFSNMSQGAVNAVKEIMEYSGEVSPAQQDEAQMKVLDSVKSLEAEGKINVRQGNSQEVYLIDGAEMSSDDERRRKFESMGAGKAERAAPAAAPEAAAQAQQYLAAGVEFYNQGKLPEALQYLEYAASLNAQDASVWQYLGAAYYSLQRVDEAVAAYEKYAALSGDPAAADWLAGFKQQVGR